MKGFQFFIKGKKYYGYLDRLTKNEMKLYPEDKKCSKTPRRMLLSDNPRCKGQEKKIIETRTKRTGETTFQEAQTTILRTIKF